MATRLLEWCAGLPLALSTIGALVDQRPGPLSQVVRELGNERNRLDALGSGEEDLDLRTLFSWSYRRMSPPARRLFRLLGVHPGPDISRESCMALCEDANPRRVLDELTCSSLATEHVAGRLLLHDLLRVYAAEQARVDAPVAERASIVRRIADHYVLIASEAASWLNQGSTIYPDEQTFRSYRDATDWFAAENAVITAVTDLAAQHGLDEHVWRMALACNTFLRRTGCRQQRINAEFQRIRRELGDLPGVVSDELRLRTMLRHLTKTLHPGVLNDCFFNAATAVCVKRAKVVGKLVPQHNMCLRCPNARRSTVHRSRLAAARDQVLDFQASCEKAGPVPKLQQVALTGYITELDLLIGDLGSEEAQA